MDPRKRRSMRKQKGMSVELACPFTQARPVAIVYHSPAPPPFTYPLADNNSHSFVESAALPKIEKSSFSERLTPNPQTNTARHAYGYCREHKAKCIGRPSCQHCEEKGVDCIYGLRSEDILNRYVMTYIPLDP